MAQRLAHPFRERIERREGDLSPLADALLPRPPRGGGARLRSPHPLPARPRPDRALEGVPPAQAQDPGLHRARGRPLPHPAHPHARGLRHRAQRRPRARAERGPHRGDRPGPRPRPPAVRPHRRGGARRVRARALGRGFRHNEHSLRVVERIEGLNLTEQVRDGILRHTGPRAARRRSRGGSCGSSTGSPTSTTTSTTPCGPAILRFEDLPRAEIELLGSTGSAANRDARARPARALRGGRATSFRARRSAARCFAYASSCSSACTSAPTPSARSRASSACCARCSPTMRPIRRRR